MKTTLKLSAALLRRAKTNASKAGVTLEEFIAYAVREKLNGSTGAASRRVAVKPTTKKADDSPARLNEPPWMKDFGAMKEDKEELKLVNARIREAFEQINPETWK